VTSGNGEESDGSDEEADEEPPASTFGEAVSSLEILFAPTKWIVLV
jgi:hypothetical protein